MQSCSDPCDDCSPTADSCNSCHSHVQGCNCEKCQKSIKCKLVCEKKKERCCHESPKVCCKISCNEEKEKPKNFKICGNISLDLI